MVIFMSQRLKEIMDRTNYWLSFAEAKCAGMGVINLTTIITIIGVLFDKYSALTCFVLIHLYILLICNIISLILMLIAMLPCLEKLKEQNNNRNEEDKNLIFYGDIATYNCGVAYIGDLYKYYEQKDIEDSQISAEERDYAEEIICISKITVRKYRYFRGSIFWTLGGVLTPVIGGIIYFCIIRRMKK